MTTVDPDNEATYKTRVVTSDQREQDDVKQAIMKDLQQCKFSKEAIFGVKLALEEALCNAVKHGNRSDASKKVTIRFAVTPVKAVIIVRDEGTGFIPGNIPDPTTPERLPLPSGRGIMLMRAYMDEVIFRDHGREVCLTKRRV